MAASAEPTWLHVTSSDFEIFSTANQGNTMDVMRHFEELRSFFGKFATAASQPVEPVRIIVFGTEKEYLPYRPSEAAAAYYTQVAGRDYIVLGGVSDQVFPIAVHEYSHLVVQHEKLNLPPWLNEGLADTYSTLKPMGRQVLIGNVIPGHIYQVMQEWIPLSTVLAVDQSSPWYNEKKKAGAFYAESWAFVHMLMLTTEYGPRFSKLLAAVRDGGDSQKAVETIYGKSLAAFDREVQGYVRGSRVGGAVVDAKLEARTEARPQAAQPFDVKLALLDLLERRGREDDRRKGLTALAAEFPQRSEPHSALAYLAWRQSQNDEALKEFRAAIDLGGKNPQMLWDYGRMAAGSKPADSLRALQLLLTVDPNRVDVRLLTGQLQIQAKQPKEALATLTAVRKVTPEEAPTLFRSLAMAQMDQNQFDEAKISGQRWLDNAKDPSDQENAKRLMTYLEARLHPGFVVQPAGPPALEALDKAPTLRRRNDADKTPASTSEPLTLTMPRGQRPSVAGNFVEFNCEKKQPRFVLKTPQGLVSFLMDNPDHVFIRGRESETIELTCGAQKTAALVWIEYDPPAGEPDIRGIARVVHFEAPGALK